MIDQRAGLREAAPYFAAMVTAALMFVGQIAATMVWGEREGHKLRFVNQGNVSMMLDFGRQCATPETPPASRR